MVSARLTLRWFPASDTTRCREETPMYKRSTENEWLSIINSKISLFMIHFSLVSPNNYRCVPCQPLCKSAAVGVPRIERQGWNCSRAILINSHQVLLRHNIALLLCLLKIITVELEPPAGH
jgi:hypothetical protein